MPLIKPRTRGKQCVRLVTRLERETNETLYVYAHFLSEPAEYVLNQLIDTVLAKDNGVCRVARRALAVVCSRRPPRIRKRAGAHDATQTAPHVKSGLSSTATT